METKPALNKGMRFRELISEEGLIVPGVNTTADVKPGEIRRQAAKFGMVVTDGGVPPIVSKDSVIKEMPRVEEAEQENPTDPRHMSPLTHPGSKASQDHKNARPGTPEWFKAWFSLPLMTGERP